jgi:hypothetical protein
MLYQEKSGNTVSHLVRLKKNKVNFRRIQSKIEKHIFSASPVCEILRALVANGLTLVLDYQGCQIFLGTKYQNE